ncbi:hypothetical protein SKUN_00499 [Spiroplasma kunkelii CR2-3x]|uniref:DUF262 domain-containing protein n=1 Tax=Spiroplasma kunkelii CR2-3x TaxID=273035 RepID=A0A0K2JFN7_SPIKU|nr:DUF262 domain-containing protein [Spiroplasma kunkelii]ALA97400.1 hypothetical protein SKUN_00499 [Spiroplasma kunkelii CR2-3x]
MKKKSFIIDGQQRMTTTIILLLVFRKFFKSINLEDLKETANDITSKYIGRITKTHEQQTLYLGESDRIFFKRCNTS